MADYFELRNFIQRCFEEQAKLNESINNLLLNSFAKSNDSVVNTITKKLITRISKIGRNIK